MSPRTILVTGASRGIGLAIAQKLLREKHNVVLVARTAGPMEELKKQYPEQVEIVVGDLSDFKVGIGEGVYRWKFPKFGWLWVDYCTLVRT